MPTSLRSASCRLGPPVLALAVLGLALVAPGSSPEAGERVPARARPTGRALARIELGRRLFFEPLASRSGQRSCASCHAPAHGFSDPDRASTDDFTFTRRHSQTLLDGAWNPSAHWDGEFATIEDLVVARLGTPTTPGGGSYGGSTTPGPGRRPSTPRPGPLPPATPGPGGPTAGGGAPTGPVPPGPDLGGSRGGRLERGLLADVVHVPADLSPAVAERLEGGGRYAEGFKAAFGSESVTLERLARALAAYCRSIESTTSAFDRFRQGDEEALSLPARRGRALFEGRAGCFACHVTDGEHPRLTDFAFHNTGVAHHAATDAIDPRTPAGLRRLALRAHLERHVPDADVAARAREAFLDPGRRAISSASTDLRAFKTPTLRDVARRGPSMHDGRFDSLAEVVRYYASGCGDDPRKDARLKGFEASDGDVADLVAFLEALSGEERPGLARTAWSKRVRRTRLRVVDAEGRPLAGLVLRVQPEGDPIPVRGRGDEGPVEVTTDAGGYARVPMPTTTHARVVLPGGLEPTGGALVPDTCAGTALRLPVAGRMTLVLVFPGDRPAPAFVLAHHRASGRLPVRAVPPPTRFDRVGVVDLEDRRVARYEGWVRSDAPPQVRLEVPGRRRAKVDGDPVPLAIDLEAGAEQRLDLTGY